MSDSLRPHESQHVRPPCPSSAPGVYSNSCPSSRWCHPAISSSVVPSSSCPRSLPAWGSFPMSQLFAWGGRGTGVSALASVLPMNTQDWSPLGWTGWISLQFKHKARLFAGWCHSPGLSVTCSKLFISIRKQMKHLSLPASPSIPLTPIQLSIFTALQSVPGIWPKSDGLFFPQIFFPLFSTDYAPLFFTLVKITINSRSY